MLLERDHNASPNNRSWGTSSAPTSLSGLYNVAWVSMSQYSSFAERFVE